MTNRIDGVFGALRQKGGKALVAFITAGYPGPDRTVEVALALEVAGANVLELGVPFSDPIADGPVIQACSNRALEYGVSTEAVLGMVAGIRRHSQIPIVVLSYYNPVFRYGEPRFARALREAGGDGLITPDLPMEESHQLREACRAEGLHLIPMLAPTSTASRIELGCRLASGFIYCVSVTGVTGPRDVLAGFEGLLSRVKAASQVPAVLGFGISDPGSARKACAHADGVVVGSAILKRLGEGSRGLEEAVRFVRCIKDALTENPSGELIDKPPF